MKKLLIYIGIASVGFLQTGCNKDFDALNTDPLKTPAANFDPNYLLTSAQYAYSSQGYNTFLFTSMWTQTLASTSSLSSNYLSNADKYVQSSGTPDYQGRLWNTNYGRTDPFYTGAASMVYEAASLTEGNASRSTLNTICKIMKVMILQQVTDVYGDIPYKEALQAKTGVTLPVYDRQQDIYNTMLGELEAAIAALNSAQGNVTGDLYYKGDAAKWKKFAYSLMLRMAMRLTKVDPATAKTWAEKAAAGGTFTSIADNAFIPTQNSTGNDNAQARVYNVDIYQTRWSKTFIDYLKANTDPRLGVIAEVPQDGLAKNQSADPGNTNPAVQLGLPNGYDLGGARDISTSPGYPGGTGSGADATPIGRYSRPRTSIYANRSGNILVLTYAETELLLAEAAARGWNVGGTAAGHYRNGVSAALQSLTTLGANPAISAATADAYALAHPLNITSLEASLKQINEQYWATTGSFFSWVENWINWKRSGYPVLTPVNYPNNFSGGTIPRRQPYPPSEASLNPTNYADAVSRLTGGDRWTSRVWWDK
jgi:hypothetical protein